MNYKNNTSFYDFVEYNTYLKPDESNEFELNADRTQKGALGENNVLLSGLVGGALKYDKHKFTVQAMHLQNGESSAGEFERNSLLIGF